MTLQKRGNRWQCLNADVAGLPTTGVSANQLLEVCDTNVWEYFNGTTNAWVVLGTNTITPATSIPGDVSGSANATISPNAPFWWNNGDAGDYGLGSAAGFLPFALTTSKTIQDQGFLPGQRLLETDTGKWYRWDGDEWVPDVSGSATIGSAQEKGGGTISLTIGTTTQSVFNIPHGIGAIPSIFLVTPANAAAAGGGGTATNTLGFSVTANATNIIVTYQAGILSTSSPVNFNWLAMN